jgi:hypothetical protein
MNDETSNAEALARRLEDVTTERDYLRAHAQNLEAELRRRGREPAQLRDLQERLARAEGLLRRISVVHRARWLMLDPGAALRGAYRLLREGPVWRVRERYRLFRLRQRRSRA